MSDPFIHVPEFYVEHPYIAELGLCVVAGGGLLAGLKKYSDEIFGNNLEYDPDI